MIWELLHARSRLVMLTAIAVGLAGCSSERFSDNHYNDNRYASRPAPQPEPIGAAAMPPSSRIEQTTLPPPSGVSGPAGAAIRPGQRLVIPRYMGAAPAPSAAPSPIASNAARPSPAPVSAVAPAQPVAATGSSGLHVVAAGDTLYKISRTYGRSVADL